MTILLLCTAIITSERGVCATKATGPTSTTPIVLTNQILACLSPPVHISKWIVARASEFTQSQTQNKFLSSHCHFLDMHSQHSGYLVESQLLIAEEML